ncbi:hypothetical protein QEG98_30160 [Myxococcus sp. MxC21-1]|uniref:hypothetical protein n=1 Tax=Myxococcus sp. MxC21-1 TaxID=3041439 RepID=UPI00292E65B8|nr:hypothetical protein [Myxococcus sp. MxC21-1]WNZ66155.1 hypothetical protein QEG98_30160 [Myxococcus sp. MxC21-1]
MSATQQGREPLHRARRTLRDLSKVREALHPEGVEALVATHFPLLARAHLRRRQGDCRRAARRTT